MAFLKRVKAFRIHRSYITEIYQMSAYIANVSFAYSTSVLFKTSLLSSRISISAPAPGGGEVQFCAAVP